MRRSFIVFFFFSSRRRHTRLTCDWSSDVCSSDLGLGERFRAQDEGKRAELRLEGVDAREVRADDVDGTHLVPLDLASDRDGRRVSELPNDPGVALLRH